MKVVISTPGTFHFFAMARELEWRGSLETIYSGFPWFRLEREGVSRHRVKTFPIVRPALMGLRWLPSRLTSRAHDPLHYLSVETQDRYVAATLPESDILIGHEAASLLSAKAAKARGLSFVCDSGCSHAIWRDAVVGQQYRQLGLSSPRRSLTFRRELETYDLADCIFVPSQAAARSFKAQGVPPDRLRVIPYGVDTSRFFPDGAPNPKTFHVLFVGKLSVRKGAPHLLAAFRNLRSPSKKLTIAGLVEPALAQHFGAQLQADDIDMGGHVGGADLRKLMSQANVLVLPSIEDGFGLVVAEAMACGCPAIVSDQTGAADIVMHGVDGLIVPAGDADALLQALTQLADEPDTRVAFRQAALAKVASFGGWSRYGDAIVQQLQPLTAGRHP